MRCIIVLSALGLLGGCVAVHGTRHSDDDPADALTDALTDADTDADPDYPSEPDSQPDDDDDGCYVDCDHEDADGTCDDGCED